MRDHNMTPQMQSLVDFKWTEVAPQERTHARGGFELRFSPPSRPLKTVVNQPVKNGDILLTEACHVDHEGFDLNALEQEFYRENGFILSYDDTWYKDGSGDGGSNAIIQPWATQLNPLKQSGLVLDHSHFVFKYPIVDEAEEQVRYYARRRPELYRLISTRFKCGLDICIDMIQNQRVEPIVHIEWDYDDYDKMVADAKRVVDTLRNQPWEANLDKIIDYNHTARQLKLDAFTQADFRAALFFKKKSYMLIPTL